MAKKKTSSSTTRARRVAARATAETKPEQAEKEKGSPGKVKKPAPELPIGQARPGLLR